MTAPVPEDPWLTSAEVAERLNMAEGTLRYYRHINKGPSPWSKRGRSVRYRLSVVVAYEADLDAEAAAQAAARIAS